MHMGRDDNNEDASTPPDEEHNMTVAEAAQHDFCSSPSCQVQREHSATQN